MGLRNCVDWTLSYVLTLVVRFFQFVMGLVVCGLYGVDLNAARKAHVYTDTKWAYAEAVGAISAITALTFMVPFTAKIPFIFVWEIFILFMWIVLFAIFGNLFIKEHAEGDSGIRRMKNAVWVDLTNVFLWIITAVGMTVFWFRHRNNRSTFTSRARV